MKNEVPILLDGEEMERDIRLYNWYKAYHQNNSKIKEDLNNLYLLKESLLDIVESIHNVE